MLGAMFGAVRKLPRLGQWNGRKRSTRQEPFFRRLGQRRVLMRVAVVWLTTAVVSALAIWWGEPMPYRRGAIYRHDVRARLDFQIFNHVASSSPDLAPGKPLPPEHVGNPIELVRLDYYPRGTLLAQ